MTLLRPRFYKRDISSGLSDRLIVPNVDFDVQRYNHLAIGGPDKARIDAAGDLRDLWQLTTMLRAPIEIYDEQGTPTWWGFIGEVRLQTRMLELSLNLERMVNSVRVSYSTSGAGQTGAGTGAKTAYATNQESIDEYGKKQRLLGYGEANSDQAETFRDAALERLKVLIPEVEIRQSDEVSAEILCRGWWSTLKWIYWSAAATSETSGADDDRGLAYTTEVAFTNGTTERAGQTINISSAENFVLIRISVWIKKTGSPGDLNCTLYTVSGGAPNTQVDTASLTASSIGSTIAPVSFTMTGGAELSAGTDYWIELQADSGDASNYYSVGVNEDALYTAGQFYTHNGSSWSADATKDMVFVVSGERATNTQLENLLGDTDAGQFFDSYEVTASGINLPARNQNEHLTALEVATEIIEQGTTQDKRLTANVTRDRRIVVEEEPATGNNYYLLSDMSFETELGVRIPKHHAHRLVRRWVTPKDIITAVGGTVRLADLQNIFIEEAEYNARRDEVRPRTRTGVDVFDFVRFGP